MADLGFRPDADGYAFENFGNEYPDSSGTLTTAELRLMFGDAAVCANTRGKCVLSAGAKIFLDAANRSSNGGHCEGFAVTSLRMFQQLDTPSDFGGDSIRALSPSGNAPLVRYIARYMASQMVEPIVSTSVASQELTPREILAAIIENLNDGTDPVTMGIYKKGGGGHAVVPYAVVDKGKGKFWVMIYDNNWPDAERHIEIDVNANKWKYDLAATNPDKPVEPWEGDAKSFTLDITPLSARDGEYVCPWCGAKSLAAGKSQAKQSKLVLFSGDGNLTLTDKQGRKLTYVNGQMKNDIPGAGVGQSRLRKNLSQGDPFVLIYLPADLDVKLSMTGSGLPKGESKKAKEAVFVFGQGNASAIDGFDLDDGETDVLTISADGNKLGYKADGAEKPRVLLALDSDSDSDYLFELTDLDFSEDEQIDFTVDETTGKFDIRDIGGKGDDTYRIHIVRNDAEGDHSYVNDDLTLSPGETELLDYEDWDGESGGIEVEEDKNSDGKVETTSEQPDEDMTDDEEDEEGEDDDDDED